MGLRVALTGKNDAAKSEWFTKFREKTEVSQNKASTLTRTFPNVHPLNLIIED